jgi:hypothetical protein
MRRASSDIRGELMRRSGRDFSVQSRADIDAFSIRQRRYLAEAMKFLLTRATLLWFALKQVYEFKGVYYAWMVSSGDFRSYCLDFSDRGGFSR